MHVILGGVANGKRRYVRGLLGERAVWLGEEGPFDLTSAAGIPADRPLVLCEPGQWMAGHLADEERAAGELLSFVKDRNVTVIMTDIGRGIVPADPQERALRDACGRLSQRLAHEAESVTRIWFGIPQKLK
ncbi:bifunctional adenosylcobinamide kinase/adenosylcobinamide-phosphate guanylyltransferase [Sporosarcina trichiuri]|uniref:bifunctional adenosylcobinamide kinase/adenosylcobinamide-phosphate guanylyltransferase n=1 Tax=Sporosarcina trichiuri TaxID=3056445 RepID=UPI0025B4C0F8|nr:bifunctional adenosylcobinamide kinase/adenosylcobinamide-phosphate guanylyltransferase [Sporosarcina sp. 0.2-SM1T-5]WJY26543.1 bifunctional adenosylcobinamide kinase/adenosylcobinamide-phosphate guanylyltransferase [Sporosarcina sp. 0.2-SM1T-5]